MTTTAQGRKETEDAKPERARRDRVALSATQFGKALIVFLCLFFTINSAFALTITNIQAPATIQEGSALQLSFTTDPLAGSYRILENGGQVSPTNSYTKQLGYDSAGLYTYSFEASLANQTVNATRTIEVLDTPLTFHLSEPSKADYATGSIPVVLDTNIEADVCYTVSEAGSHTLTKQNATRHNGTLTLADGLHLVQVKCNRNGEIAAVNITLKVDTTPPTIVAGPSGTVDDKALLRATTNEASDCRYGTVLAPYAQLPEAFPQTASLTHERTLDLEEGSYTYYIGCSDVYGNAAPVTSTSFTLRKAPTARLTIEGENPRKAGDYALTLETSEPLQGIPSLVLSYQGGSSQNLRLTEKDSTTYEGVIIVGDDAGEQVGSFTWSGTDADGNVGTHFENDELFLVDTIKPGKVTTFRAVNGTAGVNLTWYFDEEDDVLFNIYRSTESGVDYTDLYETTSGDRFKDRDTQQAVRYWYRIAAMDEAGNVGPLSHEEWASPASASYHERGSGAILDPVLQVDLDTRLDRLDRAILDAERAAKELSGEQAKDKAWLIATLDLADSAAASVSALKQARSSYEALRSLDLDRGEYDLRVTEIQVRTDDAMARLPVRVGVDEQSEYDETAEQSAISAAATRALGSTVLATGERAAYEREAGALLERVRVVTTMSHATVGYANGLEQPFTIVEKRLIADDAENDVVAIETIPKRVAKSADDIDFLKNKPIVLEQDPVVQYGYDTLTDATIAYAVKGTIPFPTVRQSRLVLLPKPSTTATLQPVQDEHLTGSATNILDGFTGSQGLLIFLGIVVIVGLLTYYFRLQAEPEISGGITQGALAEGAPSMVPSPMQAMAGGVLPGGALSGGGMLANPAVAIQAPAVTQTVLVERATEPIVGLLRRGHELIDDARYLDALYFYKRALERYAEEKFPSERMESAVKEELQHLHAKLDLFQEMNKAHDAAVIDDHEVLSASMDRMRRIAIGLGDAETKLFDKAKAAYQYFYAQHNRIQAERLRVVPDASLAADDAPDTGMVFGGNVVFGGNSEERRQEDRRDDKERGKAREDGKQAL